LCGDRKASHPEGIERHIAPDFNPGNHGHPRVIHPKGIGRHIAPDFNPGSGAKRRRHPEGYFDPGRARGFSIPHIAFVIFDSVRIEELPEFLLERHPVMVCLLVADIFNNGLPL
jgi:hypothetical protein